MKRALSLLILLVLSGCATLQSMNENLEKSQQTIQENTLAVDHSRETIQQNTQAIADASNLSFLFVLAMAGVFIVFVLFLISLQRMKKSLDRIASKKKS